LFFYQPENTSGTVFFIGGQTTREGRVRDLESSIYLFGFVFALAVETLFMSAICKNCRFRG